MGGGGTNLGVPASPSSGSLASERRRARTRRMLGIAPVAAAVTLSESSTVGDRYANEYDDGKDATSPCRRSSTGGMGREGSGSLLKIATHHVAKPPTTPRTPKSPRTPRTPRTPGTPGTPRAPRTPRTPRTPRAPASKNKSAAVADGASVNTPASSNFPHIGLTSLLSDDDDATVETANISKGDDDRIKETELYRKFEEAFNTTLKRNPGILPGAPTVIESIKSALLKIQQGKDQREREMRQKLDKAQAEKDQLEAKLRKEMARAALRKNELAQELEVAKKNRNVSQDSLKKQLEAVAAMKAELAGKLDHATKEKEELTKHLGFLSQSRAELERTLDKEMGLAERDRDALQNVVEERKGLQEKKRENQQLEAKIERLTQEASREKRALQVEVAELQKFEVHILSLKQRNEEAKKELEREKGQLRHIADTMQAKKDALMESKKELERQYQHEIDELEEQIRSTQMMHERDMEGMVKARVLGYLQRGGDAAGVSGVMQGARRGIGADILDVSVAGEDARAARDRMTTSTPEAPHPSSFDIESLIKSRVNAELERKMEEVEREEAESRRRMEEEEVEREKERVEAEWRKRMEEEARERRMKMEEEVEMRRRRMEAEAEARRRKMEEEETEIKRRRMEMEEAERKIVDKEAAMRRMEERDELKRKKKRREVERSRKRTVVVMSESEEDGEGDVSDVDSEGEETEESVKENKNDRRSRLKGPRDKPSPAPLGSISNNNREGLQSEIERLRKELELVQASNPRNTMPSSDSNGLMLGPDTGPRDRNIRDEIKGLPDSINGGGAPGTHPSFRRRPLRLASLTGCCAPYVAPLSVPSPRSAAARRRNSYLLSPRYFGEEGEGAGHGSGQPTGARPPLSARSTGLRRQAPGSLESRYYF